MDFKYRIVSFENDMRENTEKLIDIIPISWLIHKESEPDQIFCKFMPPPYSTSRAKKLKEMVMKSNKPDISWPTYSIEIKGRAKTYEEAEDKVMLLHNEDNAYTSDAERTAAMNAAEDRKALQFVSIPVDTKSLKRKLDASKVHLDDDHSTNQFSQSSTSDDGHSSENENDIRKKKKKTKAGQKTCKFPAPRQTYDLTMEYSNDISKNTQLVPSTSESCNQQQQQNQKLTIELTNSDRNDTEKNSKDYLANLMTKYYESLSKNLAAINGKLTDVIVRIEVLEESVAKLQKNIDSDVVLIDVDSTNQNENVEKTRANNESITLPIATLQKFTEFEEKISTDNSLRRKIILRLIRMVDENIGITRNIGCIMRTYFTRDLALQFTSVKKIGEKLVFIQTNFFQCLSEVLTKKFSSSPSCPLSEGKIKKSLQSVINNVKDWDGQRCIRINKRDNSNPAPTDDTTYTK